MLIDTTCKGIRQKILNAAYVSGHGHLPTCFSVVELIYTTYWHMKHDPTNPTWDDRDLFILSKGHAALAMFAVLAEFGYIEEKSLETFGLFESRLGCHADRFKVPGVEASTGSLGHGIGLAVGMSLAQKIQGRDKKVYTLVGDGESNEGSVWEALMVGTNLQLNNLTVLYDYNQSQVRSLQLKNPANRFRAFDCDVFEVNGHEVAEIKQALRQETSNVKVIVGHTVKGFGCQTFTDNIFEWHRKSPDETQLAQLMGELDAQAI